MKRTLKERVRWKLGRAWGLVMGCIITYPQLIRSWKTPSAM